MKLRLWYVTESDKAYLYNKVPPERSPSSEDQIWIPKSIVEHRTKRGNEHEVTLPDWFIEQRKL
jgi:hypothetical protein